MNCNPAFPLTRCFSQTIRRERLSPVLKTVLLYRLELSNPKRIRQKNPDGVTGKLSPPHTQTAAIPRHLPTPRPGPQRWTQLRSAPVPSPPLPGPRPRAEPGALRAAAGGAAQRHGWRARRRAVDRHRLRAPNRAPSRSRRRKRARRWPPTSWRGGGGDGRVLAATWLSSWVLPRERVGRSDVVNGISVKL